MPQQRSTWSSVERDQFLKLLDCCKFLILVISVILVNDVTGVEFRLGEHPPSSSVIVPSAAGTVAVGASDSSAHCGHLAGSWTISQATLAVEGTLRLLDRLKGRISLRGCNHIHFYDAEALVDDTLLQPEVLEVLGEGCDAIVCEVSVKVVLLHVQLDILAESVVAAVTLVSEGLKLS
jgi:hypothetical protein